MHSSSSTPRSSRRAAAFVALVGMVVVQLACATGRPSGPAFERLAPPDSSSALVYIYRLDSQRGVDGAKLKLDGDFLVALRNGEYVAVVVEPGQHEIGASLLWMGMIARSWNQLDIIPRGGETLYVKLWAATGPPPGPPGAADLPGGSDRRAEVGLYMGQEGAADAQLELRTMRQAQIR